MKVTMLIYTDVLIDIATHIIRSHPDYNAFTNNCQNFVLYLLQYACRQPHTTPKSFRDIARDFRKTPQLILSLAQPSFFNDRIIVARKSRHQQGFVVARGDSTPRVLSSADIEHRGFTSFPITVGLFE